MSIDKELQHQIIEQLQEYSIFCILNDNFTIIHCNTQFESLLGYKQNQLEGIKLNDIAYNTSKEAFQLIEESLTDKCLWKGELQFKSRYSGKVWLDTTIKPVNSDKEEKKTYYIAFFINSSDKRDLINRLKQRAHRQGLIAILGQVSLSNIPVVDLLEQTLSVVCGSLNVSSGIILELAVNGRSALVKASYNTGHIHTNKTVLSVHNDNMLGFTINSDTPVISESFSNEKRFKIPSSLNSNIYKSGTCLVIGDKNYPFGILILLSETESLRTYDEINFLQSICNILAEAIYRKNIEISLKHERELSRRYLDVAEVIIIVLDTHERILLANQFASNLLGYSQQDLAGMNFIEIFIPDSHKNKARDNLNKLLHNQPIDNENIDIHGNIIPVITKSRKLRYIKWRSSLIYDESNKISSILSSGEDITDLLDYEEEQKKLERQLSQAQKMEAVGMLAGGIAHDFNNILASILGFSDLAIEALPTLDTKLHKYLMHIRNSGLKAKDIIEQMQNINLQDDASTQAIMLPTLLKSTLKMLRSALPSSIDIKLNIQDDMPSAYASASKFNQLVMQLLINARNAISGKGTIVISLGTDDLSTARCVTCGEQLNGEYAYLSIDDDGPGIDKASLTKSLSPNDSSPSRSGLNTVNEIIHTSKGHLLINSQKLNPDHSRTGTQIKVLFPLEKASDTHNYSTTNEIDMACILRNRIMIVDDENSVASYMGELFRNTGFEVSVFCDSIEALNEFKKNHQKYDLVITDQTMPAMTGDILAGHMLNINPDLPVILCTGHSSGITKDTVEGLHIRGFLKKPVESSELLHLAVTLLSEQQH